MEDIRYEDNKKDLDKLFKALKDVKRLTRKVYKGFDWEQVIGWLQRLD